MDASVIGGCEDEEFRVPSRALLDMARRGEVILLISELLVQELTRAPPAMRDVLQTLPAESVEPVPASEEAQKLRDAYLGAAVLGAAAARDAEHVALATIARADLVVSWNFKHIVHIDKIRRFNAVKLNEGYPLIDIRSPMEVV